MYQAESENLLLILVCSAGCFLFVLLLLRLHRNSMIVTESKPLQLRQSLLEPLGNMARSWVDRQQIDNAPGACEHSGVDFGARSIVRNFSGRASQKEASIHLLYFFFQLQRAWFRGRSRNCPWHSAE